MIPLFVGLSLVNLLCLGVTMALGYTGAASPPTRNLHILAGALATLLCCGVHCVVFTYFIATAKWVQHAIAVKRLDPALAAPTRSFKMQAFPAAVVAMAAVFVAAVFGAARDNYATPMWWHHAAAVVAVIVNAVVAMVEYRAIARNGRLIDMVLASARNSASARFDVPAGAGKDDVASNAPS
jgi:hypothetical protein